jgi:probable rRNA maturation factor
MEDNFSVTNKTKGKLPSLPFVIIKEDILGKEYSLSIAFIGEKKSREVNKTYRNIDKPTNILSFLLSKKEGEILICPSVVKKQTKKFNKNFKELLGFLVIHGMLHLKGMEHSSRMEIAEEKYDQKYFCRH